MGGDREQDELGFKSRTRKGKRGLGGGWGGGGTGGEGGAVGAAGFANLLNARRNTEFKQIGNAAACAQSHLGMHQI